MTLSSIDDNMSTNSKNQYPEPLKLSASLDNYEYIDATPTIGREYPKVDLAEWLNASNADELIRDLAITSKSILSSLHRKTN
jgi:hypothetical protein